MTLDEKIVYKCTLRPNFYCLSTIPFEHFIKQAVSKGKSESILSFLLLL